MARPPIRLAASGTVEGTRPLDGLVEARLDDPDSAWSMGVPGAIAEFARVREEPVRRASGTAVTERGGIRLALPPTTRAVAYETPVGPHRHWNHALVLCLPAARAGVPARAVVTELGPDSGALREPDTGAVLVDLGLATPTVEVCVRTADPALLAALRAAAGHPLGPDLAARLVAAGPHRVFRTALGRVEVYAAIPPPDGRSPDGPHTHLLPGLLRARRTHAATVPVPDGHLPCSYLYPPHPLTEVTGRARPFDRARARAFDALLADYGDPRLAAITLEVQRAVLAGQGPDEGSRPQDPPGRAAVAVALRKLARSGVDPDRVADWRRGRDEPRDAGGDRNAS